MSPFLLLVERTKYFFIFDNLKAFQSKKKDKK